MKASLSLLTLVGATILVSIPCVAEEMPEMAKPAKEHAWLERLAGEWKTESTIKPPGQAEMKIRGEETARMVGKFWLLAENRGDMMGMPFTGIMTLGYDPKSKKYVGTWIDSFSDYLWNYSGSVAGNKLTLETKGPCPMKGGEMTNFRETLEVQDDDHKVFTSSIQEEDGSWTPMLTIEYTRKQ